MRRLLPLILAALIMQSCNIGGTRTWKDDHIDTETRGQIKAVNDKLFKTISANDTVALRAMLSDNFFEGTGGYVGNIPDIFKQYTGTAPMSVIGEYKMVNTGSRPNTVTIPLDSGDNAYDLNLLCSTGEGYVCMQLANNRFDQWLIAIIYGKFGDTWKVNGFQIGHYRSFGRTAPDYYKLAKASYDKSYLINTSDYMLLCRDCLMPCHDMIQYKLENEMIGFFDKIKNEKISKYHLPVTLENIKTKPRIFKIYPFSINDEGFFPLVCYVSTIDLKDSIAAKTENILIRKEVADIFTGINQDKKYVYYQAYNEMPNDEGNPPHRGYIDTLQN